MRFLKNAKTYFKEYGFKELIWLVLYFCMLLPGVLVHALEPGLDPSWRISISMAVQKHMTFGVDHIFTLGPLGFLATKYAIASSKWAILCFELFMGACTLFVLRTILRRSGYHLAAYILIPFILFFLKGNNLIYLITPVFIFFVLYFFESKKIGFLSLAVVISVISLYIKVNYGIVLVVLLYAALLVALFKRLLSVLQTLTIALLHIGFIYVMAVLLNVALMPYVQSSFHIINAYNDAMYLFMKITDLYAVVAMLVVGLYISGFFIHYNYYFQNALAFCSYLFGGLYLYLLLKNGFVRAGGDHVFEFLKLSIIPFVLIYIFQKDANKKIWVILICCVVFISYGALIRAIVRNKYSQDVVTINKEYIKDLVTDISYKNYLPDNANFPDKIAQNFLQQIGKSPVDIIPWEISEIYYNNLNYNPRPIIQSYSAYDEYLDTKNYEKYISPTAPDYLVYSCISIDSRQPFWDESITKRAMLSHYELIDSDSSYLLLRKRKSPLKITSLQEKKIKIELGKEYTIDNSENIQYLHAQVNYNLPGKLKRLLFQPPPLNVTVTYEDTSIVYRAIVPIVKTGVLLNKRVHSTEQAKLFFAHQGKKNDKVLSIRFEAPYGFDSEIEALIKEVKVE